MRRSQNVSTMQMRALTVTIIPLGIVDLIELSHSL